MATVVPPTATNKEIRWSSSRPNVATVENGKVTAKEDGTTIITAESNNGKKAYCTITVMTNATGITLNKTSLTLDEDETFTLVATVLPSTATNKTVTWSSSNTNAATVDNGVITAKNVGTTIITAETHNGKRASCTVTVKVGVTEIPVTSIALNRENVALTEGTTLTLTATIYPSNATDKTVTWSSDNTRVATVTGGLVTAVSAGTAHITATSGNGKTASCTITVSATPIPVTSISLDRSSATLTEGDTLTLTATVYPTTATDKTVTWSSNRTSVATVSNGRVTAISEGTATITATSNGKTASCTITVNPAIIPVSSISLDRSSATLTEGDTLTLTATVYPTNATNKTVTWSSNRTGVATVSNGRVTAISAGTATITAASNGKTASCTVTVNSATIPVSSISLDKSSATLTEGDTLTLTATVYPTNATDKTVTWSSNRTSVATVSNGRVTAISAGTATITAASNGKTASCTITVNPATIPVSSISLNKTTASLNVGETERLTATVYPTNATDKTVTWSSSDRSVATVSGGLVTAISGGTARITATSNGKTATCVVTVTEIISGEGDVSYTSFNESNIFSTSNDNSSSTNYTYMYCNAPEMIADVPFYSAEDSSYTALKEGVRLVNQGFIRKGYNIIGFSHHNAGDRKYNIGNEKYGSVIEVYNRTNSPKTIQLCAGASVKAMNPNTYFWHVGGMAKELGKLYERNTITYKLFANGSYSTHTVTCGGGTTASITIGADQGAWFFTDEVIDTSIQGSVYGANTILDANLMFYSSDDYLYTKQGYNCPGLVVSQYIYKSRPGTTDPNYLSDASPINKYYETYYPLRNLCWAVDMGCAKSTYDTYAYNTQSNGKTGTSTVGVYSLYSSQVGVSNYIPKIKVKTNISGNYNGLIHHKNTSDNKWANGGYGDTGLTVSVHSGARSATTNRYNYDIIPFNNCYFNNYSAYRGRYSDAFSDSVADNQTGFANWNVPTVMEYEITNNSSYTKDYVIYAENCWNNTSKLANQTTESGSATFIYRKYNTGNDGTWSFCQNFTSGDDTVGNSSGTNANYRLGNDKAATIAAMGQLAPGETKKVKFVSYLVNQCRGTMYYKTYVNTHSSSSSTGNSALDAIK